MALRTLDDRDSSIQYAGAWDTSGHPSEEYQGTTTYTDTAGATARVTFTGTGISVFGTIARTGGGANGPVSTYSIEGNSSTQKRFQGSPGDTIQYGVNFYEIRNLAFGRHVLVVRYEDSDMELFLDYFTVVGQTEQSPPPTPNPPVVNPNPNPPAANPSSNPPPTSSPPPLSSPSSPTLSSRPDPEVSSASAGQSSSGSPTSLSNSTTISGTPSSESHGPSGPSHSLILPPGVSAPASNQNSLPGTSGTSDSSHREGRSSEVRLDAIIGGVIGGIAAMCTLFLILVLCMRKRQRKRKRNGSIDGPLPEMRNISLEPRDSPTYEKAALTAEHTALGVYSMETSPSQHSSSLPPPSSAEPNQERLRLTPTYAHYAQESTSSGALHDQLNPSGAPAIQIDTSRLSMGPPPQYRPRA